MKKNNSGGGWAVGTRPSSVPSNGTAINSGVIFTITSQEKTNF